MIQKLFPIISTIVFGSWIIAIFVVVFWLTYPYDPLVINYKNDEMTLQVESKEVKSGGYLFYTIDYCKKMNINPIISKFFIDGLVYTIPPIPGQNHPVGCGVDRVQVYVPKAITPGDLRMRINYHFQVNPIRAIDVVAETEHFKIIK
jgi:hypothetical protein